MLTRKSGLRGIRMSDNRPAQDRSSSEHVAHFDAVSERYVTRYEPQRNAASYFFRRRRNIILRMLDAIATKGLVLDVGCGAGAYAAACVERGHRYLGLDLSPRMIAKARERNKNCADVEFVVADARRLPVASGSIDLLLCLGVLEYVIGPEAQCLAEISRVLRPGGIAMFSFLNGRSPYWFCRDWLFPLIKRAIRAVLALLTLRKRAATRAGPATRALAQKFVIGERTKAFAHCGLYVRQTQYFDFDVTPPPFDRLLGGWSVRISEKLEGLLTSPVFGWCAAGFIMVAQKEGPEERPDLRSANEESDGAGRADAER